ncbi:hypothetical protein Aduo_007808 [Ancylostoma duodenale]
MGLVVFILCICAVLGDKSCIRLEPVVIDRSYKKGEAFGTDHMLAVDDIRDASEDSDQGITQITALRGSSVSSPSLLIVRGFGHLDLQCYFVGLSWLGQAITGKTCQY